MAASGKQSVVIAKIHQTIACLYFNLKNHKEKKTSSKLGFLKAN
jgi:hypothetical protein